MKLLLGDCLSKLKELEDNSIDSIVTDPPRVCRRLLWLQGQHLDYEHWRCQFKPTGFIS